MPVTGIITNDPGVFAASTASTGHPADAVGA
jgi:hypothetical protein